MADIAEVLRQPSGAPPWFTVKAVANRLGITYIKVLDLIHSGKLQAFRVGGTFRIFSKDVLEYLESVREVKPPVR